MPCMISKPSILLSAFFKEYFFAVIFIRCGSGGSWEHLKSYCWSWTTVSPLMEETVCGHMKKIKCDLCLSKFKLVHDNSSLIRNFYCLMLGILRLKKYTNVILQYKGGNDGERFLTQFIIHLRLNC